MPNFLIFYDESNKIDQPGKEYSYYGAFGAASTIITNLEKEIQEICTSLGTGSELHFQDYGTDAQLEKYFKILNRVLAEQKTHLRIFLVNNQEALNCARKLNISTDELRKYFYIKIPERLFYGMVREISEELMIRIVVDDNEEYKKFNLYEKLVEQMNAHSAYRNKNYLVKDALPIDSRECIMVQVTDVLMGIAVYLLDKLYYQKSNRNTVKSDLIYRLLINNTNLAKLLELVILYRWDGTEDEVRRIPWGDFVSEFIIYKTKFDQTEMNRLQKILLEKPGLDPKTYRIEMGYPNALARMLWGYLDQLSGKDRNSHLIDR